MRAPPVMEMRWDYSRVGSPRIFELDGNQFNWHPIKMVRDASCEKCGGSLLISAAAWVDYGSSPGGTTFVCGSTCARKIEEETHKALQGDK